jgi:hypothetical protein
MLGEGNKRFVVLGGGFREFGVIKEELQGGCEDEWSLMRFTASLEAEGLTWR